MVFFGYKQVEPDNTPNYIRALVGGFAGTISTVILHPLDLIKVRMQTFPGHISSIEMAKRIRRCEGFHSLYNGLSAGIFRQATYTTTRLGVYYWLFEDHKRKYGHYPELSEEVLIGIYAGMAGAFVGNPSEVVLVRLMADTKPDPCHCCGVSHKQYNGLFDALYKITMTEGVRALWHGAMLTLARSIVVSTVQINCYVTTAQALEKRQITGIALHVINSIVSSFVTGLLTLPVDKVKTILQVNKKHIPQSDVIDSLLRKQGIIQFWDGFMPYYTRMAFHTIIASIVVEYIIDIYYNVKKK